MYRTNFNRIFHLAYRLSYSRSHTRLRFRQRKWSGVAGAVWQHQVEEGNKLAFHAYAKGVQIYKWNLVNQTWDLVAPQAGLFAEEGYHR